MSSNDPTAATTAAGEKMIGTWGGKPSDSASDAAAPAATPAMVTAMICRIAAVPMMEFGAPMALSMPIWATFCSVRIWKKPPMTRMPISKAK